MNNPFLRLKHYRVEGNNPQARAIEQQENHATECLAACLVFSSRLRSEFVDFMVGVGGKLVETSEMDVVTQEAIKGGYIDLVLRQTSNLVMAVEVKVKSREDGDQLLKYKKWLDEQKDEKSLYLFTLVRDEDTTFDPKKYGVNGRRIWRKLYSRFKRVLKSDDLSDVEYRLVENFCHYLVSEGIVSTYEMKDLLFYDRGLRARQAVESIFNQIAGYLREEGFQTISILDRKDYWPQLKILHPDWEGIFGDGQNWKISLWFSVPGIWKASEHTFGPSIELWHEDHGNVWESVKPKLPEWLQALELQGLKWKVFRSWKDDGRENAPAEEINVEPKRIVAWADGDSIVLNQDHLGTETDLVNMLVVRVKRYADAINSLAPCATAAGHASIRSCVTSPAVCDDKFRP